MKLQKLLLIISFIAFSTSNIFAQNNDMKARIEFEDAETAYQNQDYSKAITHLESAEKLLGKPTSKTRYLLILALNKNLPQDYEYQDLEKIKKLSKHYIDNYTTDTEKYRDIYQISNNLNNNYPKTLEEYNAYVDKKKKDKEMTRLAIEEEKRQQILKKEEEEKSAKEKSKIDRYNWGGLGYYASAESSFGFSAIGGKKGFGWGLDFRTRPILLFTEKKEEFAPDSFEKAKHGSTAVLFTATHSITYPIYAFIGAGYGNRATSYEGVRGSDDYKVIESKGIESHAGLFIKAGNTFVFRTGISINSFDTSTSEFIFGLVLNLDN